MMPPDLDATPDERAKRGHEPRVAPWLRYGVALAATAAVIVLLVRNYGAGLTAALRDARPEWVLASLGMSAAAVLLGTLRWQIVVESMDYRLGFRRALVAVLATWPLALVTPSRANDLLRAFAVRKTVPLAAGTGSVLAEKVVDMSLLLLLAAAGAAFESLWGWAAVLAAALGAEVVGVNLLLRRRDRLARLPILRSRADKLEELFTAFDALLGAPPRLLAACLVSLAIRGLTLGITYALLRAVHAEVSLLDTCALWPLAMLVGLLPVTLAGMGARDVAFIFLLGERGHLVTRANVLAATLGYSAVALGFFAIVGLPFMLRESLYGEVGAESP